MAPCFSVSAQLATARGWPAHALPSRASRAAAGCSASVHGRRLVPRSGFTVRNSARLLGWSNHGCHSRMRLEQPFCPVMRWRGSGSFGDVCLQVVYSKGIRLGGSNLSTEPAATTGLFGSVVACCLPKSKLFK